MYRENIYEVIERTGEKITTLLAPKNNGLKGYAWKALREAGLDLENAVPCSDNRLKVGDLTLLLRRGEDIPKDVFEFFQNGDLVLGVTGDDLFDEFQLRQPESGLRVLNAYDWFDREARYFRPATCFISRTGRFEDVPEAAKVGVNAKYLLSSRVYFDGTPQLQGKALAVSAYTGGVDESVADGRNDFCIDVVYTGDAVDKLGLKVMGEPIRFTDLVIVGPFQEASPIGKAMEREYAALAERLRNPSGSYTSRLLQGGEGGMRRKLGEEALEVVMAAFGEGDLLEELADLEYAKVGVMVNQGITLEQLAAAMRERQR
jgi:phosphoribosyl-ATP pyrophosphohydrolase